MISHCRRATAPVAEDAEHSGVIMEDTIRKSCWGVTIRAVMGFVGILAIAYLFGSI
jgi:hypothetical protein